MNTLTNVKYIFAFIGAVLLVGAFFLYSNTSSFLESAVTTDGMVTKLITSRSNNSDTYAPVVQFQDMGGNVIEFKSSVSSNPPSYNRGERVEVLYNPGDSADAKIKSFFPLWGGAMIVGFLGVVFTILGFGMIAFGMKKTRSKSDLLRNGVEIQAELQGVERDTSYTVNGRSPFRILCQWQHPRTREIHLFHSDRIWFDPSDYIKLKTVPVRIDEKNPQTYWVDTSFLPKLAG